MGRDPEQAKTIDRCSLQPGASHVSKYEQINYFGATVFIFFHLSNGGQKILLSFLRGGTNELSLSELSHLMR